MMTNIFLLFGTTCARSRSMGNLGIPTCTKLVVHVTTEI